MTSFRVEDVQSGWAAWAVGSEDEEPLLLGVGPTVPEAIKHARARQARGFAPSPASAVVRPSCAANGLRRLLNDRDARAAAGGRR